MARKLPHYGKYSYLVFQGNGPANIDRGMCPVLHSPLTLTVDGADQSLPMAELTPRRALIQLIDSGIETAILVERILDEKSILANPDQITENKFYLSDMPYKFQEIAEEAKVKCPVSKVLAGAEISLLV